MASYIYCAVLISIQIYLGFGQVLPEGSASRITECLETFLRGSCPSNEVIAVEGVQYGTTNCPLYSNAPGCCEYNTTDCLTNYTGTTQQAACSGKALCNDVTIGEVDTSSCGAPYPDLNHYLTMEFYCIPRTDNNSPLEVSCPAREQMICNDCPVLTPPTSGNLSTTDVTTGTSVNVLCNIGYTLFGEVTLDCQTDGSWSAEVGTCQKDCDSPTKVGYNLGTPTANTYGSTVGVVSCATGYTGTPSVAELSCQDVGTWSEVTGCTVVNCTDPTIAGYILGTPTATTYGGSVSVVSCNTGYTGSPSVTKLTCQDTGSWSDVTGCTIVDCTDPTKAGYNLGIPTATTYEGTVSVVSCDTGYTGSPSVAELTCQDTGSWSNVTGCTIVDCTNPTIAGYILGTPNATTYGGTVSVVSCDTGYTGVPVENELTCQDTGSWSDVTGCTIVDCGTPTKVGYILGNPINTTYGSTVNVNECDTGYTGIPSQSQLTCQDSGSWSDATGCFIVDCDNPIKVGYKLENVASTILGSIVGVSECDTGYTGTPNVSNIECLESGDWSAVSGCTVGNCNSPTKDGYILEPPSSTILGVTVEVTSCDTGYNGSPSVTEITCLANGDWSDVTGCIIVNCDYPIKVGFSLGTPNATIYGGTVSVVSCDAGYTGHPSVPELSCQDTGTWSEVTGCTIVRLGDSCINPVDCSAVWNATCENNVCACVDGYTQSNNECTSARSGVCACSRCGIETLWTFCTFVTAIFIFVLGDSSI